MIKVHHLNNSRSQRILWALEELKFPYEIVPYQRDSITQLAPVSLEKVHPLGKSPVITDEQFDPNYAIAESGAIIDYLVKSDPDNNFVPNPKSKEFLQYNYWLHFAEGSLMTQLLIKMMFDRVREAPVPFFIKPVTKKIANKAIDSYAGPNIIKFLNFVEQHLANNEWFAGANISGADFQMSFPLEAAKTGGAVEESHPNILKFLDKIHNRPAYKRALEIGGEYAYA